MSASLSSPFELYDAALYSLGDWAAAREALFDMSNLFTSLACRLIDASLVGGLVIGGGFGERFLHATFDRSQLAFHDV